MRKWIERLYESAVIRYLFFGGCTTMVNMVSFYILRQLNIELNLANIISIILAIVFAYVVNSKYVFRQKYHDIMEHGKAFVKFISARGVTMLIEVVGLWLLVEFMQLHELFGKLLIQVIIVILNYVFSKWIVFNKH